LIGVDGELLAAGWVLNDGGDTDVGATGLVAGVLRNVSRTIGTATAAKATATRAILACLVWYHGRGADLNVNELLFEARS
jgi:hypothetical protein